MVFRVAKNVMIVLILVIVLSVSYLVYRVYKITVTPLYYGRPLNCGNFISVIRHYSILCPTRYCSVLNDIYIIQSNMFSTYLG